MDYYLLSYGNPEDRCKECPACGTVAEDLEGHPCVEDEA